MKKILSVFLSTLMMLTFASGQVKNASTTKTTSTGGVLLATVNVYNATSTPVNKDEYSVSFQIYNRVGTQSNIRYGLELVNSYDQKIVDTQLSNESLTLGTNQSIDLKMNYKIPGFISSGNYKLIIVVKNQNGLALATTPIGYPEKIITVTDKSFAPELNNCLITRKDDPKSYTSSQIVDIKPGENLNLTCNINNKGNGVYNDAKIKIITHKKNSFGDIVDSKILENSINIKSDSSDSFSTSIPTMNLSQLYYVDMFIVDTNGNKLSSSYPINYFIKGDSITLQNVVLNKFGYKKGDKANLDVFWNYSGENPQNSFTMKAVIKNTKEEECGSVTKSILPSENIKKTSLQIPITNNCEGASILVSVFDNKGNTLDSTDIDTTNQKTNVNIDENTPLASILAMNSINKYYIIIFIAVLVLIGYGILKLRNENKENISAK